MKAKCKHCGSEFSHKPSRAPSYCSVRCHNAARRTRPPSDPRPCVSCGAVFTPSRKRGDAKYCSKACIWKATKGSDFNARIARETSAARADAMRGRGTKGYVKRGGRHEHRVVAEVSLGRPLIEGEIVHHKDGDKHNNDPSNLAVMSQGEHMREHGLGIPGVTLPWKPWESRGKKNAEV